jgi:hypothetical protein
LEGLVGRFLFFGLVKMDSFAEHDGLDKYRDIPWGSVALNQCQARTLQILTKEPNKLEQLSILPSREHFLQEHSRKLVKSPQRLIDSLLWVMIIPIR